jgi:flagellar basal body P-ring formation protein FlgA
MELTPNFRRIAVSSLCGLALSLSLGLSGAHAAAELNDAARMEALVRIAAAQELAPLTDRQRFVIGPIDSDLQVPKCSQPIRPIVASPHHMKDRVTIELRCADAKLWHIYVPVRVIGTSPVAVAVHAIVQGTPIKAGDLRIEEHDISELPLGYLDDPSIAVGLTASRPIATGAFMTNQLLVASKAVQRGQSVTLVADTGGMSIRMAGRAMTDGMVNQRVKVQNLSSGKVVEGIARSEQVVEIILQ